MRHFKTYWYLIPVYLWLAMMFGAGLVNDLCGGCVSKRGNILYCSRCESVK
jgi:hypothetical protein